MAKKGHGELVSLMQFVAIVVIVLNLHGYEGRKIPNEEYINTMHKGTIKTIKSSQDGEVIDCVEIHKQPAFDHPLINELQIEPPSELKETKNTSETKLFQAWRKIEECPKGTVPIRRTHKLDVNTTFGFGHQKQPSRYEYAVVQQSGSLHGGRAWISVWSPTTEEYEFSVSQIWVEAHNGDISTRNTIEAGWIVYPGRYPDAEPRFFALWSTNNYGGGCHDLSCPGFVQTSSKLALGSPIDLVSVYGGRTFGIYVNIYKDKLGNWWLQSEGETVGYWPKALFTTLADGATTVTWGGEVTNFYQGGHHTSTQMGSGHFSSEGFGKASYFKNLKVLDSKYTLVDPDNLQTNIMKPPCYDLIIMPKNASFGTHFYYGGPGFSSKCG